MKNTNLNLCFATPALLVILMCTSILVMGQTKGKATWYKMGDNRNTTFYDVQRDFYSTWKGKLKEMARKKGEEKQEGGYAKFKRWEAFMAPRVYPSGNMALPSTTYENFVAWQQKNHVNQRGGNASRVSSGNWTSIGPVGSPSGTAPDKLTGAGRVNFVRFDPANSNTMWVGTPTGGLWKSTNAGTSWTTNTDFLPVIGCSDLAISPTNTNVMYLATGDIEGDIYSLGVFKTTDGGVTWLPTALTFAATDKITISKLLMNPANPLNMVIATSRGIYRTTNGWGTYTIGSFPGGALPDLKDMEFKPGDANIVYAAGTEVWRSADNGVTWTQVTSGLPTSDVSRIALGVSANSPVNNSAYVYALIGKADQTFKGLYRSTNSGVSFTLLSSYPNILGYDSAGMDTKGQAAYDLAILVHPNAPDFVYTGGIYPWSTFNAGQRWINPSNYNSAPRPHPGVHERVFLPGSVQTQFLCTDGGIYRSDNGASSWTDISNNLTIGQVEGIGVSSNVATAIVAGEKGNGTYYRSGSGWTCIAGGDGGDCFIDYTNNNVIYHQDEYSFSRSDNAGVTSTEITTGLPPIDQFDRYSKWHQDPVNPDTIYTGGASTLYRSVNRGNNWSAIGTPPGTGHIKDFAIAPGNNSIIYAIKENAVSKSVNSGVSFTNISGSLPVGAAQLTGIAVSNTNSNKVWVTFSGYSAGNKVYKSINGGATWTNVSAGLPNIPVNVVVYNSGSEADAIYIGADIGVYYFDTTMSSFAPFMINLPHVAITDLEIFYPTAKLRAATYGRGVWESDLHTCQKNLYDSVQACNNYLWHGSVYDSSGNYTFIIPDPIQCDTISHLHLTITPQKIDSVTALKNPICQGATTNLTAHVITDSTGKVKWYTGANGTGTLLATGLTLNNRGAGTYYARLASNCGAIEKSITITALPYPSKPVITTNPDGIAALCRATAVTLTSSPAFRYLWNTGETTQSITTNIAGYYTVTIYNAADCPATSDTLTLPYYCTAKPNLGNDTTVYVCHNSTRSIRNVYLTEGYASVSFSPNNTDTASAGNYRIIVTTPGGSDTAIIHVVNYAKSVNDTTLYVLCSNSYRSIYVYDTTGISSLQWSTPNPNSVGIGNYTVITTTKKGCKDTALIKVKQNIATWTGAINNNWHNPGNWNTGQVPNSLTHVIIPASTPQCIISVSNATAATVQEKTSGSLKVDTGKVLAITAQCGSLPN